MYNMNRLFTSDKLNNVYYGMNKRKLQFKNAIILKLLLFDWLFIYQDVNCEGKETGHEF